MANPWLETYKDVNTVYSEYPTDIRVSDYALKVDLSLRRYSEYVKLSCKLNNGQTFVSDLFNVEIEPLCTTDFMNLLDPAWSENNAPYAINE